MVLCSFIVAAVAATVIYFLFFKVAGKNIKKSSSKPRPVFFRHCEKPSTEPISGTIKGKLPSWLEGSLTRNGPGILKVGEYEYSHLFDGLSVLHRFNISDGQATYTSRALESDTYKRNMAAQRIVVSEFGTCAFPDPCQTIFQHSVNVAYYGDQLYAMTETNCVHQLDPKNLKSLRRTKLSDHVAVNGATAHPHVLSDGTVLNMGTAYRGKNKCNYCVIKVPPTFNSKETSFKDAKVLAEIPWASKLKPCYYHSFGWTNERAIFIESPLRLNLIKLIASGFVGKSFAECMKWDPSLQFSCLQQNVFVEYLLQIPVKNFQETKIHVVSLKDGKLHPIVYETDPLFAFHHINAYEEDGQIVMDIAAYPRGDLVLNWTVKNLGEMGLENNPVIKRFVLPLDVPWDSPSGKNLVTVKDTTATATVVKGEGNKTRVFLTGQQLAKTSIELPRINYKLNGQKYKFCYGISSTVPMTSTDLNPDSIVKVDVETKEVKRWMEQGKSPSEPIFVADPKGTAEDDGVILSALLHRDQEAAVTLLVLNAKNLEEISRIEFKTAGSVTGTFHGQWAQNEGKIHTY